MVVASLELIRVREAASRLLDQLGFEAYLFEVEPGADTWTLRVECAAPGGWRVAAIALPKEDLMASAADPETFTRLLDTCRNRFSDCSVEKPH